MFLSRSSLSVFTLLVNHMTGLFPIMLSVII